MLKELLKERDYLSPVLMSDGTAASSDSWQKRRREMLELLSRHSYGYTPDIPCQVFGKVAEHSGISYAGKVTEEKIEITLECGMGSFTFPIMLYIPKRVKKPPVFLHLAFRPVADRYIPLEEICDNGFAVAVLVYTDAVNDNHYMDFNDGIAKFFGVTHPRAETEWGKIGMWAYAVSRVMDYLVSFRYDELDINRVCVIGHSRLGKTALWAGAQDERFWCTVSNNSGYGGAASSKCGKGERIDDFIRLGSDEWFCENFKKYKGELEDKKPYDQAFLTALIAPRLLCVGSAAEDRGADPIGEFFTTLNASSAWELLGERGLVCPDRLPTPGDFFPDGKVCYHLRAGRHFLSREDWNFYMRFLKEKISLGY